MIVITGAGGRLGRQLVEVWRERNEPVRVVDLIDRPWFDGCETIIGDIANPAVVRDAVAGADIIVHLAEARPEGELLERLGVAGYDKTVFEVNLGATRRLAEAARDAGVARFIYASSESVYGPPPKQCPCSEQTPPAPNGPYGRSKLEAEHVLLEMHRRGDIEPVILRFATPLGPFHTCWSRINRLFDLALRNLPIPVSGGVGKLKHCVHSRDAVDLIDRCLSRPQAAGRVYNVAGSGAATVGELIVAVAEAYDSRSFAVPLPRQFLKAAKFAVDWFDDPFAVPEFKPYPALHTCYETGRALADLGWRARYDTVQTFVEAAIWRRDHFRRV
jgi:nucleoside-diphosphate-sugar epimerase